MLLSGVGHDGEQGAEQGGGQRGVQVAGQGIGQGGWQSGGQAGRPDVGQYYTHELKQTN